jgi:hypothetical protein
MIINSSAKTPQINFDIASKTFLITGISCPDNPLSFYTPVFNRLEEYFSVNEELHFTFQLDYFNTGSSKCILKILSIITDKLEDTSLIKITWITEVDDEELLESGKIFEEMSGLNFEFIFQ